MSQDKIEFEKNHTSGGNEHCRGKIVTKRNDSWLNAPQHLQLQRWRANWDIQVIDHYACVEYLTKYAAKVVTLVKTGIQFCYKSR